MFLEPEATSAAGPVQLRELLDISVTFALYFILNDAAKFKQIWQEDYRRFRHKEDCVHYAFSFSPDGTRAHCRQAFRDAASVLQHLADVDEPFKAALSGPSELERVEVHGPRDEVDKLRSHLQPLGCIFYVSEWGVRAPKAAMPTDTVCHMYPYFELRDAYLFTEIWYDSYSAILQNAEAEGSHHYSFSFDDAVGTACNRTAFDDAEGMLLHLENVKAPLGEVLSGPAHLLRLEVHAPASEVQKLQPQLECLGVEFFVVEWGFRNEVSGGAQPSTYPSAYPSGGTTRTMAEDVVVSIRKPNGRSLGIDLDAHEEAVPQVTGIEAGGLAGAHNAAATSSSQRLQVGDFICSVNGSGPNTRKIAEAIKESSHLHLTLRRPSPFTISISREDKTPLGIFINYSPSSLSILIRKVAPGLVENYNIRRNVLAQDYEEVKALDRIVSINGITSAGHVGELLRLIQEAEVLNMELVRPDL